MYLEPNAVFIDRHRTYAQVLKICREVPEKANGYYLHIGCKRHLVQKEGDLISVCKTSGECVFVGRELESGREDFAIIQKEDGDCCLYRLLGPKASPTIAEEDIWL